MDKLLPHSTPAYLKIDHVAIAVRDLDSAVVYFTEALGFSLTRRLHIKGRTTGMLSAELEHQGIKLVLCQGTEPASQVSQLIANFGPGVAHIALAVNHLDVTAAELERRGVPMQTSVIRGPGLRQIFTQRDANSGLSFELIERTSQEGFLEDNVQNLFEQLERSNAY